MSANHRPQKKSKDALAHLLRHQKIYLSALLVLLFALSLLSNYLQEKPLLMGGESYYYLSSAQQELPYNPITMLFRLVPDQLAFSLPMLLTLGNLFLFYSLAGKARIPDKKVFLIALFFILTPAFMFSSLTLSSYSLYLFLVSLGVRLMLLEEHKKYAALLPFLLASCLDTFSALLLIAGVIGYFFIYKKEKGAFPKVLMVMIAAALVLNATLLNTPFFIGPFYVQDRSIDLISDLGSFSGTGVFTLLLAVIGLIASWQKKNLLLILSSSVIFITAYFFNTHTAFFLSLLIIVLAAFGFLSLWEKEWKLSFLKNAVLLLLVLGVFFSAFAYLERFSQHPPSQVDVAALQWIERNTDDEAVVLSAAENSYYIHYFAQRRPALNLHQDYGDQYLLAQEIFSAFYIDELFPLLEEDKVSIIYVSEEMKRDLPPGQEFLFLLQNERFKLLYFTEEAEVWSFEERKQ